MDGKKLQIPNIIVMTSYQHDVMGAILNEKIIIGDTTGSIGLTFVIKVLRVRTNP